MVYEILDLMVATLFLAVLVDIIFGEPRGFLHIAVISGKWASLLGNKLEKSKKPVKSGYLIVFLSVIPITILFSFIFNALYSIPMIYIFFLIFYAIIEKSTFSFTSMGGHIRPIIRSLENGQLEEARVFASRCVRRDVKDLKEPLLISAAIETISEGITDSFVGSLLYFSIFGVLGGLVYRIVNTLDSTFGYRDSKYLKFGRGSAYTDSVLNYIPARISSALISVSAYLMNYSNKQTGIRSLLNNVPSRNAAYSMGTMASVLNLRLEKKGNYIINPKGFEPTLNDLRRALNIFYLSFFLMVVFIVIPLMIIFSFILYEHIYFVFPIKLQVLMG
ncbi:MAG: cobalamin biosynthesis protein [Cuniculiplasma sp.]